MNYLNMLNESFVVYAGEYAHLKPTKLAFLGENIFKFTTDESYALELLTKKALEACNAITYAKTFEYISTVEGNIWYLIMVNMPFFVDKIAYGVSIRGSWWDWNYVTQSTLECYNLYQDGLWIDGLNFDDDTWVEFIDAMSEFVKD